MESNRSLKLLVITMLYEPDCVGIAAIASDMCVGLAERGHDVTVYTAYPYYPEWQRKSRANPWTVQEELLSNVRVRRHGLFIPSNPSRLFPRLIHELSFPLSLSRSLFRRGRYDAVMVFCPLLGSVAFAAFRKLLFREPLWVNIQDIPSEAGRATGINRSRIIHQLGAWAQKFLFRFGETWSSISPEMVRQLQPLSTADTTLHLCPNWLTGSLSRKVSQLPTKVGRTPRTPLQLLYCGTIGKKQGLRRLCESIQQHQDLDVHFQIRGEGSEAHAVRDFVVGCADGRFEFGSLLPEEQFVDSIHAADWFVISETAGAGSSFLPSKLIPSIAIGTPILAIADKSGPLGREVGNNGIGITVEWSQIDSLPQKLQYYAQNPEQFIALQRNCLKRAQAYNRSPAINRMESLLTETIAPCCESPGPIADDVPVSPVR